MTYEEATREWSEANIAYLNAHNRALDSLGDVAEADVRAARAALQVPDDIRERMERAAVEFNTAKAALDERRVVADEWLRQPLEPVAKQ